MFLSLIHLLTQLCNQIPTFSRQHSVCYPRLLLLPWYWWRFARVWRILTSPWKSPASGLNHFNIYILCLLVWSGNPWQPWLVTWRCCHMHVTSSGLWTFDHARISGGQLNVVFAGSGKKARLSCSSLSHIMMRSSCGKNKINHPIISDVADCYITSKVF